MANRSVPHTPNLGDASGVSTFDARTWLEALIEHLNAFNQLLDKEQKALIARDTSALDTLATAKQTQCDHIQSLCDGASAPHEQSFNLQAVSQLIEQLPDDARSECEPLHTRAVELAKLAKDSNTVNGMILRRTQQSTIEVLNLINGRQLHGLYGTSGESIATRETNQTIAKA